MLAQAPISCGGYFQFKDDKKLQSEVDLEEFRSNKMFALDVEHSLSCIPFHERCGLQEEYLTIDQLEAINERAFENQVWYGNYLKELQEYQKVNQEHEKDIKDELDKMKDLSLVVCNQDTIASQKKVTQPVTRKMPKNSKESQEELEEWLDDILNTVFNNKLFIQCELW